MKKTLVAIAALAATSAFAQSSVTISGNLDFAYGTAKAGTAASQRTISTRDITASTSVINIVATEDLGGGTAATVKYGIDPRKFARDQAADKVDPTNTTATTYSQLNGLFASDETFVGLAGASGNVRLGSPNSVGLNAFQAGSPLGTGVGSGYAYNHLANTSYIRFARSARYDSPSFNGFTVSALRAQGASAAVAQSTNMVAAANDVLIAAKSVTELGAAYANGPLNVAFAQTTNEAYSTDKKRSATTLGANYNLGATTVYVGMTAGKLLTDATAATTQKGSSVGVKQSFGNIDLLGSLSQRKDGTNAAQVVTGLRADYNLSKTAAAYVGYETFDKTGKADDFKVVSVGLKKSF